MFLIAKSWALNWLDERKVSHIIGLGLNLNGFIQMVFVIQIDLALVASNLRQKRMLYQPTRPPFTII